MCVSLFISLTIFYVFSHRKFKDLYLQKKRENLTVQLNATYRNRMKDDPIHENLIDRDVSAVKVVACGHSIARAGAPLRH